MSYAAPAPRPLWEKSGLCWFYRKEPHKILGEVRPDGEGFRASFFVEEDGYMAVTDMGAFNDQTAAQMAVEGALGL